MATLYHGLGKVRTKYPLSAPVVVAGREAGCGIVLKGAGVSRKHCRFVKDEDGYCVEDLGSANGTYVNGARVSGATRLSDGDKIAVMGHIFTYVTRDEGPEAAPAAEESAPPSEYTPTMRVDPDELLRRLEKLFDRPGTPLEDIEEPGDDESGRENRT